MATCKTCGATIEVPEGWGVGASVRRHYWAEHPDRMVRTRADKAAEEALPPAPSRRRSTGSGPGGSEVGRGVR
jgi:hypothetical protein